MYFFFYLRHLILQKLCDWFQGKTTVALKMGQLYKEMGFINTGHTVQATRADLVGQYIGHTGPKTKVLNDDASFLHS